MIKRIAPLAGALALACAALIGCSDSSVSPTETPAVTTDPYVTLSIDNGSLNTFSEIPNSVDDMMDDPLFLPPPPPDSLHPRDCDTNRRGGGPPPLPILCMVGDPAVGPATLRRLRRATRSTRWPWARLAAWSRTRQPAASASPPAA